MGVGEEGLISFPHFPTAIRTVRNNIGFFFFSLSGNK